MAENRCDCKPMNINLVNKTLQHMPDFKEVINKISSHYIYPIWTLNVMLSK